MSQAKISTELLRRVRLTPTKRVTDYRDPKVPGFVLRARPSGVHSWRVQLPDRRWVSLGRYQTRLRWRMPGPPRKPYAPERRWAEVAPKREDGSRVTLGDFLQRIQYEPWMRATYKGRTRQVDPVRAAFVGFREEPLTSITAARLDRWRADRHNRRGNKAGCRERRVLGSTINRDLAALQAALSRAVEWGQLAISRLARMKRVTEDESGIVRVLVRGGGSALARGAECPRCESPARPRYRQYLAMRAWLRPLAGVWRVHRPPHTAGIAGA